MEEIKCPHCYEIVPRGARVCKGCQAEIDYGTPSFIAMLSLIVSVVLGFIASGMIDGGNGYLGFGVGIVSMIAMFLCTEKIFSKRVKFKRVYKHNF